MLALIFLVTFVGPVFQRHIVGTVAFFVMAGLLGILTFFITAGWNFRLSFVGNQLRVYDRHRETLVPLDRIGLVVRNGGFPFPSVWLVLRNASVGTAMPAKGVEPTAAELIEAYRRRNPGKEITIVQLPGGYLSSIPRFVSALKERIPPLTVDQRLGGK